MNFYKIFLTISIFIMISCTVKKDSFIEDKSVEKEIDNFDSIDELILIFSMNNKEIDTYYKMVVNLIDKEPSEEVYDDIKKSGARRL